MNALANACVPCERRQLVQNTTAVVRSMAQTLQAIPPGGNCDEAATNEITRCIATLRAGSLRWAQHRMAAMEIRDEKDMETHQHISVERILEQQMQQLDLILTRNPALLAEVQTRSKAYLAGLATIYKQRRELQGAMERYHAEAELESSLAALCGPRDIQPLPMASPPPPFSNLFFNVQMSSNSSVVFGFVRSVWRGVRR